MESPSSRLGRWVPGSRGKSETYDGSLTEGCAHPCIIGKANVSNWEHKQHHHIGLLDSCTCAGDTAFVLPSLVLRRDLGSDVSFPHFLILGPACRLVPCPFLGVPNLRVPRSSVQKWMPAKKENVRSLRPLQPQEASRSASMRHCNVLLTVPKGLDNLAES